MVSSIGNSYHTMINFMLLRMETQQMLLPVSDENAKRI